jgi:Holliday junction DNA helicase RuvB
MEETIGTNVNDIRVRHLDHMIGQKQVVKTLRMNLDAHFKTRSMLNRGDLSLGPVLFVGPPGVGKTMMAKTVHCELGNDTFIETNGVTASSIRELYSMLIRADSNTTVFVDEAQALSKQVQNILLTAISEKTIHVPLGVCSNSHCTIPLAPFTLVLATTHEFMLSGALLNRFSIYCRFELYSTDELTEIVRQRANTLRWPYESEQVLRMIAQRSKGVPRLALNMNLQTCRNVAITHDRPIITIADVDEAFELLKIDELGLEKLDRSYLGILMESGPTTLAVLSSKLTLPSHTLQMIVEPYLLREGFITKDRSSRRVITPKASRHIETVLSIQQGDKND